MKDGQGCRQAATSALADRYFEGLDAERAIAWRAADLFALREFLGLVLPEAPPDHSTISRTRRLIDLETHEAVLSDLDRLFACLNRAVDERDGSLILITAAVEFDPVRGDARFTSLLERMELGYLASPAAVISGRSDVGPPAL